MKKNIVSTAVFTFINLARSSVQLLLLPLHAYFLTPEEYGIVSTFSAAAAFFLAFNTLGLKNASERSFADPAFHDSPEKSKALLSTLFACATAVACLIAFIAGGVLFLTSLSPLWQDWFKYGTFAIAQATLMAPVYLYGEYLRIRLENKRFVLLNAMVIVLTVVANVILVAFMKTSVAGVFLSVILAQAAGFFLSWYWIAEKKFVFEKDYVKPSVKFGLTLLPHAVCSTLLPLADRYIVVSFAGLEKTGSYSAVNSLCAVLYTIAANMGISFRAEMYRYIRNKDGNGIRNILHTNAVVLSGIAATWVLWSQEIIMLLMPRSYHEAYDLVPVLSLRHLLHIGTTFFLAGVLYHKDGGRSVSRISLYSLLVLTASGSLLTWQYGTTGMAWATVLASAAYLIQSCAEAARKTSSIIWPWKTAVKPVLFLYVPPALLVYFLGWQEDMTLSIAVKSVPFLLMLALLRRALKSGPIQPLCKPP